MDIPYMIDSDPDSLNVSNDTIVMHEDIRTSQDTDPFDGIDLDLYAQFEQEEEEEPVMSPKEKPVSTFKRSKATTISELEDELIESICDDKQPVFGTLYLLHEQFAKSKTATRNEKAVMKGRIINIISTRVTAQKLQEISTLLNNFFN
jgi:translation initiation factor 2 alpha subunit (eIF-2alpha)